MMSIQNRSRLRVGVIGAGFISQVAHLHSFAALLDSEIVALSDPRPQLLARVAGNFSVPNIYARHEDLIADADIDAVVVCVHRRCLAPLVEQVLIAGKAVLSEKPMAYSSSQAQRLLDACAVEQVYAVGFMKRFDPGVRLFRDLLNAARQSGSMGELLHVEVADFCPTYGVAIPAHVRTEEAKAYRFAEWAPGPDSLPTEFLKDFEFMLNVGSHDINLVRWLFDDEMSAVSLFARSGSVQTAVLATSRYDVLMRIGKSDTGVWNQSLAAIFSRGRMELKLPSPLARQETSRVIIDTPGDMRIVQVPSTQKIWAFQAQAAHFTAAARGEVSLEIPGVDSLNDVMLIEDLWAKAIWRQ